MDTPGSQMFKDRVKERESKGLRNIIVNGSKVADQEAHVEQTKGFK
jgi:hypothetical protein